MPPLISLSIEDRRFAKEIFNRFSKMPGSEHIASEASLQYLAACPRLFKPAKVLEMGAGIGTITETVLSHPCGVIELVSTEANPFCLKSLRENLRDFEAGRLTVVTSPSKLSQLNFSADLIIGDGGFYSAEEMSTAKIGTVFFTEGRRGKLRDAFSRELSAKDWTIAFENYGSFWKWGMKPKNLFGLSLPLPRYRKGKGCWIGVVKAH